MMNSQEQPFQYQLQQIQLQLMQRQQAGDPTKRENEKRTKRAHEDDASDIELCSSQVDYQRSWDRILTDASSSMPMVMQVTESESSFEQQSDRPFARNNSRRNSLDSVCSNQGTSNNKRRKLSSPNATFSTVTDKENVKTRSLEGVYTKGDEKSTRSTTSRSTQRRIFNAKERERLALEEALFQLHVQQHSLRIKQAQEEQEHEIGHSVHGPPPLLSASRKIYSGSTVRENRSSSDTSTSCGTISITSEDEGHGRNETARAMATAAHFGFNHLCQAKSNKSSQPAVKRCHEERDCLVELWHTFQAYLVALFVLVTILWGLFQHNPHVHEDHYYRQDFEGL